MKIFFVACAAAALHVTSTYAGEANKPVWEELNMTHSAFDVMIENDRVEVNACNLMTEGYLNQTLTSGKYTDNSFFDCFRPASEVFTFLDAIAENSNYVTKIAQASSTIEGENIPVYKVFTGGSGKKAIYIQGLIHAREWIAGSSVFFTIASLVDDLHAGVQDVVKLLEKFDFYFTPILNIDGYKYTWTGSRYWRKNRRQHKNGRYGVDLNRNFPPQAFFNKDKETDTGSDTYPGTAPLSEPEVDGIWSFLKKLNLGGAVDVHSYGALVLRPYGNQAADPDEPYKSKVKMIGDSVRDAIQKAGRPRYTSEPSRDLYYAYGCFDDGLYMELKEKVPVFTIEVEGSSFVASQSTIRPVGRGIYAGLLEFARGAAVY
jgi:hypothetical protein